MTSALPGTVGRLSSTTRCSRECPGEQAREWLAEAGSDAVAARAVAIETVVRELLQIVVIDLTIDENAQEIFETLNARGAQLTAADLIKNFIFQRLLETGTNVEDDVPEALEGV